MNLWYVSLSLWVASLASSLYSIIFDSVPALLLGVMFALAGIAQEQFDNWGK